MSVLVTLHVFSGRRDPVWSLSDRQFSEFQERVDAIERRSNLKASGVLGRLGYRGFSLQSPSDGPAGGFRAYVHSGIVDTGLTEATRITDQNDLEQWLLDSAGDRIGDDVRSYVATALEEKPVEFGDYLQMTAVTCPRCVAVDAPTYDPQKWNVPNVQPYNNCYNYANNQITNTFAQPGRATGKPITSLSCGGVQPSAESDGLKAAADFSGPLGPGDGWYVALVIWPGQDYHWYRQDQNGCWSHKPGGTAVRDVDNAGKPITDPRTCDRGPYTSWCTYMTTNRGVIIK